MQCSEILTILGLIFNTLGALILIVPSLRLTRNIEEEHIQNMDAKGNYTQNKHIREQQINFVGLVLLSLGFILQLLAILLS